MNATAPRPGARLLSLRAASQEFGIPRPTLAKLLSTGELRGVRLRGVRRVFLDREDMERLIAAGKEAA